MIGAVNAYNQKTNFVKNQLTVEYGGVPVISCLALRAAPGLSGSISLITRVWAFKKPIPIKVKGMYIGFIIKNLGF